MNSTFSGVYAQLCKEFIAQKRALGYRYEAEERQLHYFDEFSKPFYVDKMCLPKALVEAWVAIRPYEAEKSRQHRVTVIREFARFMIACECEAYILPPQKKKAASNFVPYIFTKAEITRLLNTAEQIPVRAVSPYIHMVMPVLLRVLYGCGLRASEVLTLRVTDVNLEAGTMTIRHSKFDNSRLVPMSDSLKEACKRYAAMMPVPRTQESPFFPNRFGQEIGIRGIYGQYRALLWRAGISHGGRGNGPRLHDLRHTFAVHSMRQLIKNGRDLYAVSPILSTYLGHRSLAATQKYLRLVAEIQPELVQRFEDRFAGVVPGRPQ